MTLQEELLAIVFTGLDEINETRSARERIPKDLETILVGPQGRLDSLGAVTLLTAIDERAHTALGLNLDIVQVLQVEALKSPLRTVGSLIDYLRTQISEARA